jgi:hypothetical protein
MKPNTRKLAGVVTAALLDIAHEGAKSAVNEATRRIHAELGRQKQEQKKRLAKWARK